MFAASALAFAGLMVSGAWWWMRRRDPAAAAGGFTWPEFAAIPSWADLSAGFAPALDAVQGAADAVAETVQAVVAPGAWSPPAKASPYLPAIYAAEDAAGAPRNLFARQIKQESNFNPAAVNSRSGAQGIAQFMPATWAEWGRGGDVFDAFASIDAQGRYMRWLYERHGEWKLALAAYNWGTGNVARKGLGAAPPETVAYVDDIVGAVGLA